MFASSSSSRQPTLSTAFFALVVGSFVAPLVYVLVGFIAPEGFHNLRGAEISVVLAAFASSWLFSALLTFAVGGASWAPLHVLGYDSFASYTLIAVASSVALYLISGAELRILGLSIAVANAGAIRTTELALKRYASRNAQA
jgi:fumarate reductase subunit D